MESVTILGRVVPIGFRGDISDADRTRIMAGMASMADLIEAKGPWEKCYADAYAGMKEIVFFAGEIIVNGFPMSRPCCDEDDAVFYWEVEEFLRNMDDDVHAHTLFHDCWHVVQFKAKGDFARGDTERVAREVDAIGHQIEVARQLGCDAREIGFLEKFCNDETLRLRLAEGVGKPIRTGMDALRTANA